MKRRPRLLLIALSPLILTVGLWALGLRYNATPSVACGLYWAVPGKKPLKGDVVIFRPDFSRPEFALAQRRGYLIAPGFGPVPLMFKRVVAAPGDVVDVTSAGVAINGETLPQSAPAAEDARGDGLPSLYIRHFTLPAGYLLVMSDARADGYDGRYFGPIPAQEVQSVVLPLWTW
jgi:conjugative transfer signal peptidase TraF